ncbi:MAG: IMP dehydrogenase [Ignavibacteria bacterium]|nr:IMP dehydrogenase [Bacteroidota bacterium]MSQ46014.1 IMP dehydrogenase [Ignavibacteria bacterium]
MKTNKKIIGHSVTFDDILLVPQHSKVLPREVDVRTKLTKNISLNIPLLSSAMDTVTEASMAIAIAREGGMGVLHKNMSISQQAEEVDKVKRSESGMILDPITLTADKLVGDALLLMSKFRISGIPIVDNGKLVGILTNRDLRFKRNLNDRISEVMTSENLITAAIGTTLEEAESILQKHKVEKLPIVDKNGMLKGLLTVKDIQKKKQYPNACKDKHGRLRVGAAVGVTNDVLDRVEALVNKSVDLLFIDTAHGHSQGVVNTLSKIKKKFPKLEVVVGNIATAEAAKELIKAGADGLKVGIGSGSICTTRIVTGVGVPQITAIFNTVEVAKKYKIPIIADGGIRQTGDIAKAIAAGANCVMIGGLFAGLKEAPGEEIIYEGRTYKIYRGMGSIEAMRSGSKDRYFQDVEDDIAKLVPEGIEGRVPFKGELSGTVYQMVGGLRAAMGYCGSSTIKEFQKKAKFVLMSSSGLRESHPHDVKITKEAPNYHI